MDSGVDLVKQAGWEPGRWVDPASAIESLQSEGLEVPAGVVELIAEFDRLEVGYERNGRPDSVELFAIEAAKFCDPTRVAGYSKKVGAQLVPLGSARQGYMTLFVTDDQRWFGAFDSELWLLGNSLSEVVERLRAGTGHVVVEGCGS